MKIHYDNFADYIFFFVPFCLIPSLTTQSFERTKFIVRLNKLWPWAILLLGIVALLY